MVILIVLIVVIVLCICGNAKFGKSVKRMKRRGRAFKRNSHWW